MSKNKGFFDKIFKVVKKIPSGQVATYGQLARMVGTRDARKVGFALHANTYKDVPCHRVVDRNGRLAPNFAFDGEVEQRRRLLAEGITFKSQNHVDLGKHLWGGEIDDK